MNSASDDDGPSPTKANDVGASVSSSEADGIGQVRTKPSPPPFNAQAGAPSPSRFDFLDGMPDTVRQPSNPQFSLREPEEAAEYPDGNTASEPIEDAPKQKFTRDPGQGPTNVENIASADSLSREAITEALYELLSNRTDTKAFTVGLFGRWGSGKSSQINLLKQRNLQNQLTAPSLRFVEFNAWEHEKCDNLSAALAQTIMDELVGGLSTFQQFKLARNIARLRRAALVGATKQDLNAAYYWLAPFLSLELVTAAFFILLLFSLRLNSIVTISTAAIAAGAAIWKSLHTYLSANISSFFRRVASGSGSELFGLPDFRSKLGSFYEIRNSLQHVVKLTVNRNDRFTEFDTGRARKEENPQLDDPTRGSYLVMVIDDLDRCSVGTVKLVLDAVRLITNIPRIVTIVAIDDRIAYPAVSTFFEQFAVYGQDASAVARDYLAKVFNVSIQLPVISRAIANNFIREKLFPRSTSDPANVTIEGPKTPEPRQSMISVSDREIEMFVLYADIVGITNPRTLWRMKQAWLLTRNIVRKLPGNEFSDDEWIRSLFVREAVLSLPLEKRNLLSLYIKRDESSDESIWNAIPHRLRDLINSDLDGISLRWPTVEIVLLPAAQPV